MGDIHPNGRDARGLFAPGNQHSKGNVGRGRMTLLRRTLVDCATPEKVKEIEAKLYSLAISGDIAAIKIWLDHLIGRPVQAVELSGPDGAAPGLDTIMTAVLTALADYPQAQLAVAAKLKEIGRVAGDDPGLPT